MWRMTIPRDQEVTEGNNDVDERVSGASRYFYYRSIFGDEYRHAEKCS